MKINNFRGDLTDVSARKKGALMVWRMQIYYCGGLPLPVHFFKNTSNKCAIFTPDATGFGGTWSTKIKPMLDGGRNHGYACTDGNRMFVFGGRNNDTLFAVATSQVYDPVTDTWLMSGVRKPHA